MWPIKKKEIRQLLIYSDKKFVVTVLFLTSTPLGGCSASFRESMPERTGAAVGREKRTYLLLEKQENLTQDRLAHLLPSQTHLQTNRFNSFSVFFFFYFSRREVNCRTMLPEVFMLKREP